MTLREDAGRLVSAWIDCVEFEIKFVQMSSFADVKFKARFAAEDEAWLIDEHRASPEKKYYATLSRFCARYVVCWSACPLAFVACHVRWDAYGKPQGKGRRCRFTSLLHHISATSIRLLRAQRSSSARRTPAGVNQYWLPHNELPHMPGSSTTPGRLGARAHAPVRLPSAFATASAPGI